MHLPSRGLRLSATTMRYTGVFFVPTRFMRIFTDINISKERENYQLGRNLQALNSLKFNRLIQLAALGASGTVHVGIVGIDEAAFAAAKDVVFRVGRAEAPPVEFR